MPRKRQNAAARSGNAHPLRTDLNAQAPAAPTGLPYGEHKALVDSQRVAPVPSLPAPGPAPMASPGTPAPPGGDPFESALAYMTQASPLNLGAPSDRPSEPITHGLPVGPGGGPEVLGLRPQAVSSALADVARATGDPALMALAAQAQARGV